MSILNLLTRNNLAEEDFLFDEVSRKVRLKNNNVTEFVLTKSDRISVFNNDGRQNSRMKMSVFGRLGILNLDFTPNSSGRIKLFDLPANAPLATTMITNQTHTGGLVWLEANSREIMGNELQAGTRVLVTMIGFFNTQS